MYRLGDMIVTSYQIKKRLEQEKRYTTPCPFCKGRKIQPNNVGAIFFMECQGCGTCGPVVSDYHDPNGLSETSWTYALKVCHDKWNGAKRD